MLTRTTLSLEEEFIKKLRKIQGKNKFRSLSQLINTVLKNFVIKYEQQKKYLELKKGYQAYNQFFSQKDFELVESAALSDLTQWK